MLTPVVSMFVFLSVPVILKNEEYGLGAAAFLEEEYQSAEEASV